MIAWAKFAAIGALAGGVVGFIGGWSANGWRLGIELERIRTAAAEQKAENTAREKLWADHAIKIGEQADAAEDARRAAVARADAAARSLHDAGSRHAAAAASAPGTSEAAAAAIHLHADLRRRATEALRVVGEHADAAYAASVTCERFDEVTR